MESGIYSKFILKVGIYGDISVKANIRNVFCGLSGLWYGSHNLNFGENGSGFLPRYCWGKVGYTLVNSLLQGLYDIWISNIFIKFTKNF